MRQPLIELLLECQKELGKVTGGNAMRLWWRIECRPEVLEWRKDNVREFYNGTPTYDKR